MFDILSDVFETIRLKGTLYFRTDYSPPWAITVPEYEQAARFHFVIQGCCHVSLSSGANIVLEPGDVVLIPRGRGHVLADRLGRAPAPLERVIQDSGYDGKGAFVIGKGDPQATTQMVCGHLGFSQGADHPLLGALPEVIVITQADRGRYPLLDEALRLIARQALSDEAGAAASIARLSEIFFIEAVRASVERHPPLANVMTAMTDRHIGRALELVHETPGDPWTVETLAKASGMSRSRFAERFTELVGVAPMAYVMEWRLQIALARLGSSKASVKEVAAQAGYQSAAAFARAFSQRFGIPPTDTRGLESS
ncbi:AraC family transcriptional regulator [Bradyrhizobium guangzhouense]|uniref:AraC family transcriptional regulator n=1 Tax=Bradyrhizobium guangzhouense TaxID=1325095 RepID=UPI001009A4FF|nr:AraC family transcriptional regulator [Bradyrhizobium guangzhouense]RXH05754.1 AraC family transcriptional regulator [Bradyrhizobium guangzhouense]